MCSLTKTSDYLSYNTTHTPHFGYGMHIAREGGVVWFSLVQFRHRFSLGYGKHIVREGGVWGLPCRNHLI
jgi:hypothetical protein